MALCPSVRLSICLSVRHKSNFLTRFSMMTLGRSKENKDWHVLAILISLVLKSLIKKLLLQNPENLDRFWLTGKRAAGRSY